MLSYLFEMPNATSFLADVGDWSIPIFNDFLPIVQFAVGIGLALLIVKVITGFFKR